MSSEAWIGTAIIVAFSAVAHYLGRIHGERNALRYYIDMTKTTSKEYWQTKRPLPVDIEGDIIRVAKAENKARNTRTRTR